MGYKLIQYTACPREHFLGEWVNYLKYLTYSKTEHNVKFYFDFLSKVKHWKWNDQQLLMLIHICWANLLKVNKTNVSLNLKISESVLAQCSISISPENIRKQRFLQYVTKIFWNMLGRFSLLCMKVLGLLSCVRSSQCSFPNHQHILNFDHLFSCVLWNN